MKTRLLYFFCLLLLVSCGGGNRKAVEVGVASEPVEETDFFVFDLEGGIAQGPKATTMNEIADSISYIPLETHPDALLPNSYGFAKIGSDMFIGGGRIPGGAPIYQFDPTGRFVKQVTYHGRGPGEILTTMEWYANPTLAQINVVSIGSYMVVTSTESGERFTVGINDHQGFERVPLNDSTFVSAQLLGSRNVPDTYLYFTDRSGNVIHSIERNDEKSSYYYRMPEGAWTGPYESYRLWSNFKGDAIFHDIFNDTLYRIKSHREITPHLVLKRGALSPNPKDTYEQDNKKKQVYLTHVKESGNHVFFNYYHSSKIWCDVWSKHDGRLLLHTVPEKPGVYPFDVFVPYALPDGSVIDLQVVYADRDNVYCVLEALDACKFMPEVKEDDNPVIVVAKLRR